MPRKSFGNDRIILSESVVGQRNSQVREASFCCFLIISNFVRSGHRTVLILQSFIRQSHNTEDDVHVHMVDLESKGMIRAVDSTVGRSYIRVTSHEAGRFSHPMSNVTINEMTW